MKNSQTILTAALALMLAACNVESDFLSQKKALYTETITVSANRDDIDVNGPEGTRAVLTEDNTLKSIWKAGDQLTVWTGNEFTEDNMSEKGFTLDSGAGTNSATFTGTLNSKAKPNKNTMLTAVIDNGDDAEDCSSGTTAALDFSVQEGCTTDDVLRYDVLWAQASYSDRNFLFTHAMSIVEWTIKIKGITAATTCDITLSATGMQNKAEFDLYENKLNGTNGGDITLQNVSIDAQGKAVIYFALFPGQVTSKMTAAVTVADGSVTTGQLGTFDSFTFKANNLYIAAWTFDAPEMPTYTLTATSPAAIEYNETTTGNYTVKSSATIGGTTKPVPWTVTKYEYSDDGGITWEDETPSWFSSLSLTGGEGSIDGENGTATVTAAELVYQNPVNGLLKNATVKSNYDLSDGKETANCYVISAPGTYKIPLIYGNARNADGSANTACFNNNSPYVNYRGTAITSMYLTKDGTPSTGSLVWSDCGDNIVSNLAVSNDPTNSDLKFLTFTVPAANIVQGNAVVAVKDDEGTIMWSWHLWFTDSGALSTTALDGDDGEKPYFTRDNLGSVYDTYQGTSYTTPRRVRVTVTQTGSNKTALFYIIQNPFVSATCHDTKYQWGRKDAFPGVKTVQPTYIESGSSSYSSGFTYQEAIKNPGTMYSTMGGNLWCYPHYTNAWAVNNKSYDLISTSSIVKSVYDPCPVGFKMPGSKARSCFSKSNGTWVENQGYTFTNGSNSLFFPATGQVYYYQADLRDLNKIGYYWTAIPYMPSCTVWLLLNWNKYGNLNGSYYSNTPFGLSVRPVKSN